MENVLPTQVRHFVTWLRFAGMASFWGLKRVVKGGASLSLRLGFHVKGGFGRV
jgi:hypothetical protein